MKNSKKKGFTLIELMIVVVILGILAAVAIPKFLTTKKEAEFRTCQSNLASINSAIEEWQFINGVAITDALLTSEVLGNVDRFPDGPPKCAKEGAIYRLGLNNRADCSFHGTIANSGVDGPTTP